MVSNTLFMANENPRNLASRVSVFYSIHLLQNYLGVRITFNIFVVRDDEYSLSFVV